MLELGPELKRNMKPLNAAGKASNAPVTRKPAVRKNIFTPVKPVQPPGRMDFLTGVEPGMPKLTAHFGMEGTYLVELQAVILTENRGGSRVVVVELIAHEVPEDPGKTKVRVGETFVLMFSAKNNPEAFARNVVEMTQGLYPATPDEINADPDIFKHRFAELVDGSHNGRVYEITFILNKYIAKSGPEMGKEREATNISYGPEVDTELAD